MLLKQPARRSSCPARDIRLEFAHNREMLNHATLEQMFGQLDAPFTGEALFDHLHDIVFFIKNPEGQYVIVNETLVRRCGVAHKGQLIGRTTSEVLRPPLGNLFEAQDHKVLRSGESLLEQLELHIYPSQEVGWCVTTKIPLLNRTGKAVGLVGISKDLGVPDKSTDDYQRVARAVQHAEANLSAAPRVVELAEIAGLSRYQLDRRMRRVFGLTTGQFTLRLRIDLARQQLEDTDDSIASIALNAGYSDQSAFTRQFRRATGLTPGDYRAARRKLRHQ